MSIGYYVVLLLSVREWWWILLNQTDSKKWVKI